MRILDMTSGYAEVRVLDEKGQGNANHEYKIYKTKKDDKGLSDGLCLVSFQNGPIKEFGVNGVTDEDLLAIVVDRLRGFQSGDFACGANQHALAHVENAFTALMNRTAERENRGVEGTNKK